MMKRLLSFLLAIVMILSFIPTAVFASEISNAVSKKLANPFKDVKKSDWFYDSVQYARVNGFFNGISDTKFDPNGTMNRGMFVTVLGRMAGVDATNYKGSSSFDDVPSNAYYAPYVAWAAKHGITTGTGDGNFSPDLVINRQQMATFLVRYFETFNVDYETDAKITTLPKDLDSVASWAKDAVVKLWENGLLNGDGVNFNPAQNATRSQTAAIAARADEAVSVWYKEPGIPSDRVRIDPETGLPFGYEEEEDEGTTQTPTTPTVTRFAVTYTDGVAGEVVFKDQCYNPIRGSLTPEFKGTPSRTGYTFAGWSPTVEKFVTSNITYTAQWIPLTPETVEYTITYTDGVPDEEIFADIVYTLEEGSATPAYDGVPFRSGYTFIGWNPEIASTVTENVTYTAQWKVIPPEPVKYTVTYTDGVADEEIFADQTETVNEGSDTPAFVGTPKRDGYIFKGWSPSVADKVTGNVTYTAQWEAEVVPPTPVEYTVTYTDGVADEEVFADQTATLTEGSDTPDFEGTPKRDGYIFKGWSPAVADKVTGNVTYTAQWELIPPEPTKYTVTYTDGVADEEIFADQTATLTEGSDTPAFVGEPERDGYTFKGWSPAVADKVTGSVTYTAQWEVKITVYAVNFYDGDRLIDTLYAEKDQPLGAVPEVKKSSKANATLLGYYVDPTFNELFYAENPVTGNMNVYAKYEDMGPAEELNFTSFAQMDQTPDISFLVVGTGSPEGAITLEVMDGSDPVELSFEETDDGYRVYAANGFNLGCSYQLNLSEGWSFKDKADTIRTASFSIAMDEVENLRMNDDIVYIKDTAAIKYTVGGTKYDVLTPELVNEKGGSFSYDGDIYEGDIVCIYVGTHPFERDEASEMADPAVYVKISDVSGSTVKFEHLSDEEQGLLYNIPDNLPIIVASLPTGNTGSVNISALDIEMYVTMMGEGYTNANALDKALEAVEIGDFVTLYTSSDEISSENDLYYGEIVGYDDATGEITFKKTTRQAILDSMDLYSNIETDGSDYITEEEKESLEAILYEQIEKSGFAEDAAFVLADIVTKTDGFKNNEGIKNFLLKDADGNELTDEQLELLNIGGSFELSDDIKLTVELITKGSQLHFKGGVQLAVKIEAEFEVELEDDEKIAIELEASFVQEVAIDPRVSGSIVYKEILWIPIPVGVKVGATIDIRNFTAFSFEAVVYTVAPEDESLWDQFKDVMKNPEKLAELDFLPDELKEGLETAGDVFDKIRELEDNAEKVKDKYDQYTGYLEDIDKLWGVIEENGLTTREDWKALQSELGQTSITSDLLGMFDLTTETGIETEYYESLDALLDRYCEMLEHESDWVKLVEKEMFTSEYFLYGIVIGVEVSFVVRADLSLAIGSNLQYQVGKRYEFWFKIGLFKPSSGSSTMDLIDEQFAFQFYIMGRLGLKAGIAAKFYVGIGTGKLASIGIKAELGPYIKLYGFFVYEYTKFRAANTNKWESDERMAGALFMEFGLYFILSFEAEALGLFEYSYDFLDEEIPLLTAGTRRYYYMFDYSPEEGEMVLVKDEDGNSNNGIIMKLPEEYMGLKFIDLSTGVRGIEALKYTNYNVTLSNPNFTYDQKTGLISVNVPDGVRYMECDLTFTYRYGKMAFSTYDMTVTVPLVWTNLATEELTEYYTASVRVGNNIDGFETVWSKRVLKNKEFDLPTVEEIMELIGWNDYKYSEGTGYGDQVLEGLTIIENEVYDFNIKYKTYAVTVDGVQNDNGTTKSRTYYAKFGEKFNFSDIIGTGTNDYSNNIFTIFSELTTDAVTSVKIGKDENGDPIYEDRMFDISRAVDSKFADKIAEGMTVTANYVDNSATVTFKFTGIDESDIEFKVRRGDVPSIAAVESVVSDYGMAIKDVYPEIGAVKAATTFQIICGELTGPSATIYFEENGGDEVEDITKVVGSLIGSLPTPIRSGYKFDGWYADADLTQAFAETKIPDGGATLYAKWSVNEYKVTFHVNGGDALADDLASKNVAYGDAYGSLPKPERTGFGFIGWFTSSEDGEMITEDSIFEITGNQTLYAQWRKLKDISESIFDFGSTETFTYEKDVVRLPEYTYAAESGATYSESDFKLEYIAEGYEDEGYFEAPYKAGTYGVKITRPADDYYAKYEVFITGVMTVNKATRSLDGVNVTQAISLEDYGFTYIKLRFSNPIYDTDSNAQVVFSVGNNLKLLGTTYFVPSGASEPGAVNEKQTAYGFTPNSTYKVVKFLISGDRNYEDAIGECSGEYKTWWTIDDTTKWTDSGCYDISWYNKTDTEFTIYTPEQLAGFAYLVNSKTESFRTKTVKLGADLRMHDYIWNPIGNTIEFRGTFDGQGHTISGLYYSNSNTKYVGFFAIIAVSAVVKNVVIDDSYFYGKSRVGGVVGYADLSYVLNCTSYATVNADEESKSDDYQSCAGGIVGLSIYSEIYNCVNYGKVYSAGRLTGGIVGYLDMGFVGNCANFGSVTGSTRVGGVVGCSEGKDSIVINNYNIGNVGPNDEGNDYIGAIVGRNVDDEGTVQYNYYLAGCAKGYDGKERAALGKDGGSVPDGNKEYYCSSFASLNSTMGSSAKTYSGMKLIDALNAGIANEFPEPDGSLIGTWVGKGKNGYPIPQNSYTSALRK